MPRSRSFTSEFEEARRRAPKVGARAPQTLSGSDARWNDERPVCDPAVRTSLGGGRGEAYQHNATPQPPAGGIDPPGWANISRRALGVPACGGGFGND